MNNVSACIHIVNCTTLWVRTCDKTQLKIRGYDKLAIVDTRLKKRQC